MPLSTEDFLEHYGVKGMKWGVRKTRDTSRTVFSKSPKKLTDSELKRRIERLEREKQYNKLNRRDISEGERIATELLTQVGRTAAATAGTAVAVYGARRIITRFLGPEVGSTVRVRR